MPTGDICTLPFLQRKDFVRNCQFQPFLGKSEALMVAITEVRLE